jgi:hypothetical protein
MPGQRDQHTACVTAHLVENDLSDFTLVSLPDNDTYSHKRGPFAQVTSIASADRALERIMHAAGGPDEFLAEHAVIVMSDHSQTAVADRVNLAEALGSWGVLMPGEDPGDAEIAVCPSQRSAQVYVLDRERRDELVPRLVRDLRAVTGLDVIVHRDGDEAAVWTPRGELRFAPGGELTDRRGGTWGVDGKLAALGLEVDDGRVESRTHPLALSRLWTALGSSRMGDVLVSADGGYEFVDWGGIAHIGGGSHGSLMRGDSLGALILCGVDPPPEGYPEQWTIADVTPLVLGHFTLPS